MGSNCSTRDRKTGEQQQHFSNSPVPASCCRSNLGKSSTLIHVSPRNTSLGYAAKRGKKSTALGGFGLGEESVQARRGGEWRGSDAHPTTHARPPNTHIGDTQHAGGGGVRSPAGRGLAHHSKRSKENAHGWPARCSRLIRRVPVRRRGPDQGGWRKRKHRRNIGRTATRVRLGSLVATRFHSPHFSSISSRSAHRPNNRPVQRTGKDLANQFGFCL